MFDVSETVDRLQVAPKSGTTPRGLRVRTWLARPSLCVLLPALLAFVAMALPSMLAGTPEPQIHDEWGYLLSADTFAGGRLTNPTHPQWVQFETVHQFHVPSYQSKYPPAQAMFLALGQVLWHPILGVWISGCCLVASLVWMLLAWVPARWAVGGGLFAIAQYLLQGQALSGGTHAYWSQSYWGGAVAATGGALLFGAVARTVRGPRVRTSVAMVCGLLLMANSRPQEGLLVSVPTAIYLLCWMVSSRAPAFEQQLRRLVLPVVLGLSAGGLGMARYNHAVTGDPLEMPWLTHYEQYCVFPVFLWQEQPPNRDWRHPELAAFHGDLELTFFERHAGLPKLTRTSVVKLVRFWIFYIGLLLIPLLLFLPRILRDPWMRFLALIVALVNLVGLASFSALPHYSAPVTGAVLAFVIQGLRHLAALRRGSGFLPRQGFSILVFLVALSGAAGLSSAVEDIALGREHPRHVVQRELEAAPGKHLVFVSYGPLHQAADEWVYNDGDIDAAKVVWARDMGAEGNAALVQTYPNHRLWRMRVRFDREPQKPIPYE